MTREHFERSGLVIVALRVNHPHKNDVPLDYSQRVCALSMDYVLMANAEDAEKTFAVGDQTLAWNTRACSTSSRLATRCSP